MPSWETVVDNDIYVGGLRLFGSCKIETCKTCHGKMTDGCLACKQLGGKINLGRVYTVTHFVNGTDGSIRELTADEKADLRRLAMACTIREPFGTERSDFVIPSNAPLAADPVSKKRGGGKEPTKPNGWVYYDPESAEYKTLARFIHEAMPVEYANTVCTKMSSSAQKYKYIMHTRSRYCPNLKGEHNSKTIYFFADRMTNTVVVKCTCKCDKLGTTGKTCADWESEPTPLSMDIASVLFPGAPPKKSGLPRSAPKSKSAPASTVPQIPMLHFARTVSEWAAKTHHKLPLPKFMKYVKIKPFEAKE